MRFIYLIPILIGVLISFNILKKSDSKANKVKREKMIDTPFENELSNKMYFLSYTSPFKYFVNDNKVDKRVKKIEDMILRSGEGDRLNYRVYVTIQLLIIITSLLSYFLITLLLNNIGFISKLLFNIKDSGKGVSFEVKAVLLCIALILCLLPKQYLKLKCRKKESKLVKDLPILQLFIILMLKSKRPLKEVLYVLSITDTVYKDIFSVAYRKYLRSREESIFYLEEKFENTKFLPTVKILSEYEKYSKEESIRVLENGLKAIKDFVVRFKRKQDRLSSIILQLSVGLPFGAVLVLGFAPLVYLGLNTLMSAF